MTAPAERAVLAWGFRAWTDGQNKPRSVTAAPSKPSFPLNYDPTERAAVRGGRAS